MTAVAEGAAAPASATPGASRGLVMIAAVLGTGMVALDMTIGAVALPHIRGTFSATKDQIGWVLTSYIVATAVMIPASGWLANRFGRKEVYIAALVGFTGASVLCGLAQTLPQEVAFRVLQGMCGAPLVPLAQTMILDSYPTEKHGHAISIWGFGVVLGPILGVLKNPRGDYDRPRAASDAAAEQPEGYLLVGEHYSKLCLIIFGFLGFIPRRRFMLGFARVRRIGVRRVPAGRLLRC